MSTPASPVLAHWGLEWPPFQDHPEPERFFQGGPHQEVLERLRYALVGSDTPFAILLGPRGTGKSLVQEMLAADLEAQKVPVIAVRCVTGRAGEPWGQLATAVGREIGNGTDVPIGCRMREVLGEVAREWGQAARLLVDDAHRMSPADLEEIQWLADGPDGVACQIVLAGIEETERVVADHDAIASRCLIWCRLRPLTFEETGPYVLHRLRASGHATGRLFDDLGIRVIHAFSRGVPRVVNRFCRLALEIGALTGARSIGVEEVRRVVLDYYSQRIPFEPFRAQADGPKNRID